MYGLVKRITAAITSFFCACSIRYEENAPCVPCYTAASAPGHTDLKTATANLCWQKPRPCRGPKVAALSCVGDFMLAVIGNKCKGITKIMGAEAESIPFCELQIRCLLNLTHSGITLATFPLAVKVITKFVLFKETNIETL